MGFMLGIFLVLYLVAALGTYYSMRGMEKKGRIVFVMVATGVIYFITQVAYQIMFRSSGITHENMDALHTLNEMMILVLTPVNVLITLPVIGRAFSKLKENEIEPSKFYGKLLLVLIVLGIALAMEMSYSKEYLAYTIAHVVK